MLVDSLSGPLGRSGDWHWWHFPMVLFFAGMQAIPADLYEAAHSDGLTKGGVKA